MSDHVDISHTPDADTDSLFYDENYVPPADPGPEPDMHWEDVPPPPDDVPPFPGDDAPFGPEHLELPDRTLDRARRSLTDEEMADKVVETIRECFAAMHEREGSEVKDLVNYVMSSANPLKMLPQHTLRIVKRTAQVILSVALDNEDAEFNLYDLPDLQAAHPKVVAEVNLLRNRHSAGDLPGNPTSVWRALCDHVQKEHATRGALSLVDAIQEDLPADELMKVFSSLEPPTTQKTVINESFSKSAAAWIREKSQAEAERPPRRISSGYRTLDFAMTQKRGDGSFAEPLAAFGEGEVHVLAAPSGNGKSSAVRRLITAAAEDLVTGWGCEHARVLLAFTEESADVIAEAAGLMSGQPFHHLQDNIILADVGASRKRFIKAVWDLVIEAYHRSKETGLPIVDCGLPALICLDYITAIQEQGENETLASEVTMDLLLRGLAGWRLQEMEQFSGENFAAYAGMSWPSGMENFKPSVMTFAQFRKIDGAMFFDPATCNREDFVVENEKGEDGWNLEVNDFRVPRIADVRGSGKIAQHATTVILLHRSRPNASRFKDPETGKYRLSDDRARWIFLKTRVAADLRFIPMRFDSNATGNRGQFYDLLGEMAIEKGAIKPLPSYTQPGDPILPRRPNKSPFHGIAY